MLLRDSDRGERGRAWIYNIDDMKLLSSIFCNPRLKWCCEIFNLSSTHLLLKLFNIARCHLREFHFCWVKRLWTVQRGAEQLLPSLLQMKCHQHIAVGKLRIMKAGNVSFPLKGEKKTKWNILLDISRSLLSQPVFLSTWLKFDTRNRKLYFDSMLLEDVVCLLHLSDFQLHAERRWLDFVDGRHYNLEVCQLLNVAVQVET